MLTSVPVVVIVMLVLFFVITVVAIALYLQARARSVELDQQIAGAVAQQDEMSAQLSMAQRNAALNEQANKDLRESRIKLDAEVDELRSQVTRHIESEALFRASADGLRETLRREQLTTAAYSEDIRVLQGNLAEVREEVATYRAQYVSITRELEKQEATQRELRQQSLLQFEQVADKLFKERAVSMTEHNKQSLEHLLGPLQSKIRDFENKMVASDKESVDRHASLKELVKIVSHQSDKVAQDANNLAKALKGDFKKQGNWGELILQNILDKSGLEQGREYHLQVSASDENHKVHRPDVIIDLPDGKKIIIDSKVSLVAYDGMVAAESEEEAKGQRLMHAVAVRKHVDDLSAKSYQNLYQVSSPDFVLMFVPIDTAFSTAIVEDNSLFDYAFQRSIIIVTPSTLLATLKTVETIWKIDKQNRNAQQIAEEAGKMYDKLVSYTEDILTLGKQLNTVTRTYDKALNKLSSGRGNLVGKAQRLQRLGVQSKKDLPKALHHQEEE